MIRSNNGPIAIFGKSGYGHYFGGNTWKMPICSICDEPYHQILTLDTKDEQLNWLECSLKELPLISCVNCSTCWERQFYHIDEKDRAVKMLEVATADAWQQDEKDKIGYPLPVRRLKLEPLECFDDEEIIESMGRDYFCKLGGKPVSLTDPIEMCCKECGRKMQYVGVLTGSDFENIELLNGVDFYFGDMFLYFYYCDACNVVGVDSQPL